MMSDLYVKYIGNWINLKCKKFTCMGKIESINVNKIILSNAILSNAKICTRFTGIDVNLILEMDFVQPPSNHNKNYEKTTTPAKPELLNVYTSETQPPSIRRGGSSSAVNRNLMRHNISKEKYSALKSNSIFSEFSSARRKSINENQINEPAWMHFSPEDNDTEFDFDKNLALFDKGSIGNCKKQSNESSDSSDSVGIRIGGGQKPCHMSAKARCNTISFDPDDFCAYEHQAPPAKPIMSTPVNTGANKRDILSEFKQIGIIPSTATSSPRDKYAHGSDNRRPTMRRLDVSGPHKVPPSSDDRRRLDDSGPYKCPPSSDDRRPEMKRQDDSASSYQLLQQPDLVREITQRQLKNGVLRSSAPSVISINTNSDDFPDFTEFWKLDNDHVFPVFTVKQRDLLLETACQLGLDSDSIGDIVGETISDFVITQVGGRSRINEANLNRVPKIVILLGRCNASVYAASVAKCLLKKGCHILVFVDDTKSSDVNYKIEYEIAMLGKILAKNGPTLGYNFITYNVKDLLQKNVDFIISGVESDSSLNEPSHFVQFWCLNKASQLLCINPPPVSFLPWKIGVFIGVPTSSHDSLDVKMIYHRAPPDATGTGIAAPVTSPIVSSDKPNSSHLKKADGLILVCNLNLPDNVFSFLNLSYRSPFTGKNWVRLYARQDGNELCSVE